MTNISPTGGIVPLPIAQPPAAGNVNEAPAAPPMESVVPPISKADKARADLPEDRSAEAQVRALAERPDAANRVASASTGSGMHVVSDGVRNPVETDPFGKPTQLHVAVPDAIPDKIPY